MRIEFTHTRDRAYARRMFRAGLRQNLIFNFLLGVVLTLTGMLTLAAAEAWAILGSAVALGLGRTPSSCRREAVWRAGTFHGPV